MLSVIKRIIAFFSAIFALLGVGVRNTQTGRADDLAWTIRDKSVVFEIPGNPTTGYAWTAEVDGDAVIPAGSDYRSDAHGNIGGAGGTYSFTFAAAKEGEAKITFLYARAWEDEPLRTVVVTVIADSDLHIAVQV